MSRMLLIELGKFCCCGTMISHSATTAPADNDSLHRTTSNETSRTSCSSQCMVQENCGAYELLRQLGAANELGGVICAVGAKDCLL